VKKGQLLMQLWNADQQAEQQLAAAALETARKRVVEVCTWADNAVREAQRRHELFEQGFISESADANARVEADARSAACTTAKSDVAQARARVNLTRVVQGRTVLTAPFDGTVAKIVGEVGEYSTPSPPGVPTPPAIGLIDESCLYVKAPMDEVDAPKIAVGLPVRITLDALPKQSFPGKVRRIAPYVSAAEKQARTVDVEVDFEHPAQAGRLLVGYSADVEIVLEVRKDVLRVPNAALSYRPKEKDEDEPAAKARRGTRVHLLEDGAPVAVPVRTGITDGSHTEVLEGALEPGDPVIVRETAPKQGDSSTTFRFRLM
jgi:HlyD family secretion protein